MPSGPEHARRERLRTLVAENARRRHRRKLLDELAGMIEHEPSLDDFLSLHAAEALQGAVVDQGRYHLVAHRIWGDRFAGEVARTLGAIGDRLRDEKAYLLLRYPIEAVLVPVAAVLRHAALHLSHASDLTLVTVDAQGGCLAGTTSPTPTSTRCSPGAASRSTSPRSTSATTPTSELTLRIWSSSRSVAAIFEV